MGCIDHNSQPEVHIVLPPRARLTLYAVILKRLRYPELHSEFPRKQFPDLHVTFGLCVLWPYDTQVVGRDGMVYFYVGSWPGLSSLLAL